MSLLDWVKHPLSILLIAIEIITIFIASDIYLKSNLYQHEKELTDKLEKYSNECIDIDEKGLLHTYIKKSTEKCISKEKLEIKLERIKNNKDSKDYE